MFLSTCIYTYNISNYITLHVHYIIQLLYHVYDYFCTYNNNYYIIYTCNIYIYFPHYLFSNLHLLFYWALFHLHC
eukprot:UN06898